MNNDLISRSELKKAFSNNCVHNCYYCNLAKWDKEGACYNCGLIDNVPTVVNEKLTSEKTQGKWGKWVISEIRCPNCLEYFQTDCYSMGELNKCPCCGAKMITDESQ